MELSNRYLVFFEYTCLLHCSHCRGLRILVARGDCILALAISLSSTACNLPLIPRTGIGVPHRDLGSLRLISKSSGDQFLCRRFRIPLSVPTGRHSQFFPQETKTVTCVSASNLFSGNGRMQCTIWRLLDSSLVLFASQ